MATRGELDYRINTRLNSRGIDAFNRKLDQADEKIARLRGAATRGGGGGNRGGALSPAVRELAQQSRQFQRFQQRAQRDEQSHVRSILAQRRQEARLFERATTQRQRQEQSILRQQQQQTRLFQQQQRQREQSVRRQERDQLRQFRTQQRFQQQQIRARERDARRQEAALRRQRARGGNLLGVGFSLQRVLAAFAVFEAGRQLANITTSLVGEAIAYNRQLEVSQASLTGLIAQAINFRDEFGEVADVGDSLGVSASLAREQVAALRIESRRTTASFAELLETFQTNTNLGLRAGLDLNEVRQFTVLISQAATALGLPQNQLAEEVRSLLNGTINPRNSRIAVALGITNEQIRNARAQGQLFEFLSGELEAFGVIAEAQANTLNGRLLRLRQVLQELAGEAGGNFTENLRQNLGGLLDVLLNDDLTLSQSAVDALRPFFDAIDNIQGEVFEFFDADNLEGVARAASELGEALEFAFEFGRGIVEALITLSTFGSDVLEGLGISARDLGRFLGAAVPELLAISLLLRAISGSAAAFSLARGGAAGAASLAGRGLLRFIPVAGQLILALDALTLVVRALAAGGPPVNAGALTPSNSAVAQGFDAATGRPTVINLQEIDDTIDRFFAEARTATEESFQRLVVDLSQGGLEAIRDAVQPINSNELRFQQALDNFLVTGDALASVLPRSSDELDRFLQQLRQLESDAVRPFDEFSESFEQFLNRTLGAPEAIERLRSAYDDYLATVNSQQANQAAERIIQSFGGNQGNLLQLAGALQQLRLINDAGPDAAAQQLAAFRAQTLEIRQQFQLRARELQIEQRRLQLNLQNSTVSDEVRAIISGRLLQITEELRLEREIANEQERQLRIQNQLANLQAGASSLGAGGATQAGIQSTLIDPTTTGDAFFQFGAGLQDNTASAISAGIQQGFLTGNVGQGLQAFALSLGQSVLQALSDAIGQSLAASLFAGLFAGPAAATSAVFPSLQANPFFGAHGGWVGFDEGGKVPMSAPRAPAVPGLDRRDTVAARLRPGEFVVRPEAALGNLGFLSRLNKTGSVSGALASRIRPQGFAGGGLAAMDISGVRPGIPSGLPGQGAPAGSSTTPTPRMPGGRDTLRETVVLTDEALERSRGGRALEDQLEFFNGRNRRN